MERKIRFIFIVSLLAILSILSVAAEERGMMYAYSPQGELVELPLENTDVKVDIAGVLADVEVTQRYVNTYSYPIEATYVFPLPHDAAVYGMTMTIGDRTIKGEIKKRDEAKKLYEEAKEEGKRAGLLEEERPNIFTQSVANILPGDVIEVRINYVNQPEYDDGTFTFVFPMVVGPRYIPPDLSGDNNGWEYDEPRVPDGDRITLPNLLPGQRSGHDISLTVSLDAGIPLQGVRSTSHQVSIKTIDNNKARVVLSKLDSIPNKDFILTYDVAGADLAYGLLAHRSRLQGYFTLIIQPPELPAQEDITPKEMVFVIDTSGSMRGQPLDTAKAAMRESITKMNPGDTFRILTFSSRASSLSEIPLTNSPENVKKGLSYIDNLQAGGGTNMREGVMAALTPQEDPSRLRIVFFITDGFIGNEDEVLGLVQENLGNARVYPLGIGSSMNRYLLDQMAKSGKGTALYATKQEETSRIAHTFYDQIAKPLLTDVYVDWGLIGAYDVYPKEIPDLFSAKPIYVHGKYIWALSDSIKIHGKINGKPITKTVQIQSTEHSSLPLLWARHKIADLTAQAYKNETDEIVNEITRLGLLYSLTTKYTSFVAIDSQKTNSAVDLEKVVIPIPLPEGVSYEGIYGSQNSGSAIAPMGGDFTTVGTAVQTGAGGGGGGGGSDSGPTSVETAQNEPTAPPKIGTGTAGSLSPTQGGGGSTLSAQESGSKNVFRQWSSWLVAIVVLTAALTIVSWSVFQNIAKNRKNVLLVSFHDAKGKRIMQSLSNETAKRILEALADGELTASEIAKKLGLSASRVHYQLKMLLEAKLIVTKHFNYSKKGREMDYYALTNKYYVIGPPEKNKK